MSLSVGETVIHPHHGAARVEDLEQRNFGGEQVDYVVLQSPINDLTVKVPISQIDDIGIRPCMSRERLDEVLNVLSDEPSPVKGHWSRRLKRNQSRMRSGDAVQLAMVVRDLTNKLARKGLSPAERRIHRTARKMLHGEVSAVVDGGPDAAEVILADALDRHVNAEPE